MTTIYIVVESGGSYEDAWETNLHAFTELSKAEKFMNETKANQGRDREQKVKLKALFDEWFNLNANPHDREHTLEYPRWTPGLGAGQITNEMRQERQSIFEHNEAVKARNKIKDTEWQQKAHEFLNEKRTELGMKVLDYFSWPSGYYEETSFEIEELELD